MKPFRAGSQLAAPDPAPSRSTARPSRYLSVCPRPCTGRAPVEGRSSSGGHLGARARLQPLDAPGSSANPRPPPAALQRSSRHPGGGRILQADTSFHPPRAPPHPPLTPKRLSRCCDQAVAPGGQRRKLRRVLAPPGRYKWRGAGRALGRRRLHGPRGAAASTAAARLCSRGC